MTPIALTVNGKTVQALVEPRTHLADFLREHCRLTGTHLGCEHGVCGACTVLIAGAPARSCLTYAIACDGLAIETMMFSHLRVTALSTSPSPTSAPGSTGIRAGLVLR